MTTQRNACSETGPNQPAQHRPQWRGLRRMQCLIWRTSAISEVMESPAAGYVPKEYILKYIKTTLATGAFPKISWWKKGIMKFLLFIFPIANPDFEHLYESVNLWWLELDDNTGTETIYLIASKEPLTELEQLLIKYQESKRKLKKKLERKIADQLISLTTEKKEQLALLPTRLRKPEMIGGTFRGELDKKEIENYLFNFCSGSKIAFKIIKIEHR